MYLKALEVSLELNRALVAPIARLRTRDRSLVDQLRGAAASITLNLEEGCGRHGGDRMQLWRTAYGSGREVRAALLVAESFGDLDAATIAGPLALLDRILAMTWRLTH